MKVLYYLCMTENDFVIHKTYFIYIFPKPSNVQLSKGQHKI